MGGTVARTAALLSNHPSGCPVRTLLLLGSPVSRPAVGIDASMDALYAALNRAWRASFYTKSSACLEAYQASSAPDQEFDDPRRSGASSDLSLGYSSSGSERQPLTANWRCGRCIAGMRVVSITGGKVKSYRLC